MDKVNLQIELNSVDRVLAGRMHMELFERKLVVADIKEASRGFVVLNRMPIVDRRNPFATIVKLQLGKRGQGRFLRIDVDRRLMLAGFGQPKRWI